MGADAVEDVFTSHRLPPDVKNVDTFNRACRSGRVVGASKRGRVWTCSAEAWRSRADVPTAGFAGLKKKPREPKKPSTNNAAAVDVSDDLLAELGARRAG